MDHGTLGPQGAFRPQATPRHSRTCYRSLGSDLPSSLPQQCLSQGCHTAVLQPHQKTPVLQEQLATLSFGLATNTGCILLGKSAPGQFSHFALKPVVTQWRHRLPFFRTQD